MLRPTVDDPTRAIDEDKDPEKVEQLKEKMRILLEAPLFFTSDIVQHDLMSE